MSESLFPYQIKGAEWLSRKKVGLLADEMGLGKSAQTITACDLVKALRVLVLCPASARLNWLREFERFSPIRRNFSVLLKGSTPIALTQSVIASYDLATRVPIPGNFDVLILDEVHFLKSVDAQRSRAVFGKEGLVRRAKRVWGLSGTPMTNHPGDLWTLLYTFGATQLRYEDFVAKFCTYYEFQGRMQITGAKRSAIPQLKALLSPIMLRRKKDDVMRELPPITYDNLCIEPSPVDLTVEASFTQWFFPTDRGAELFAQMAQEQKVLDTVVGQLGYKSRYSLKALEALAPSISALRRYVGLQKVQGVADIVKAELDANAYEKIVIFGIHRDVIEGLRVKLAKYKAVTLYGGTDPEKRQKHVDKFQRNPKCRVFIGNIMAAGTAITLTSAHNIIFIEQDWNYSNNAQAAMRCHRIGQTKPVYVRFAGLADSLDEKISWILKRKLRESIEIFDDPALQEFSPGVTKLDEEPLTCE